MLGAMDGVEIRLLGPDDLRDHLEGLAAVLADCVAGGASVSYMAPFTHADARAAFEGFAADAGRGGRLILAAFDGGRLVGTVQVVHAAPPNQPHRADIAKLLVHRDARRHGIAERLMDAAETKLAPSGRRCSCSTRSRGRRRAPLQRIGWSRVGVIPNYALYPDGRPLRDDRLLQGDVTARDRPPSSSRGVVRRRAERCDVELLHAEHRLHRALGASRIGIAEQLRERPRHDLPREAEAILQPAARAFLAASASADQ